MNAAPPTTGSGYELLHRGRRGTWRSGLFAVAALAVVSVVGCSLGASTPARSSAVATAQPTATASAPTPTSSPSATTAKLGSIFWYSLAGIDDGQGSLKGWALSSGELGGKTNPPLTLPALAWANGPRAGRVLVGSDDGRQSTVQIVDSGGATIVWHTARLVWRGILMPDGSVILTLLDRATRRDGGVVRLVPRAAPVEIVKPALEPGFGKAWSGELFADARGKVLARQECAPGACRTRFYSVERGFALIASREGKFCELVGLTDTQFVALGQEACESQRPRDVVVGSISTGSTKKVGRGDTAALYVAAGTPHLAIGGTTATGYAVNAISLDGAASVAVPVIDGATLVAQPEANASNYSLPDGWIAFAPDGRVGPDGLGATFVNPESGATVDSRLVVP